MTYAPQVIDAFVAGHAAEHVGHGWVWDGGRLGGAQLICGCGEHLATEGLIPAVTRP